MNISVIIPVFNAGAGLHELYTQLMPAMEAITKRFEVVLVDDGSGDRSWEIISKLAAEDKRLRGIKLSRNFGQHNALLCGIRAARYDVTVTMDDDRQHPVSEIAIVLDKLAEGYDVVYGIPVQDHHDVWRNLSSRITRIALKSAGVENAVSVSAFRAFYTRLRSAFADYRSPSVSIDVLLTWGTSRFGTVRVKHAPRLSGKSNYTFRKLITHAVNVMTGFSTLPLKLASLTGFMFTLLGISILVWVVGRYLIHGVAVPGFAFLASTIAIFSGAQLFTLGIFGEYLARIFMRTMDRPAYVILDSMPATLISKQKRGHRGPRYPKGQGNILA